MHVTLVHIYVKPENLSEFIAITKENHEASILEDDNFRFDVLQDEKDECHFILYEAYRTLESVSNHKETGHYKKWRDVVAPFMARPREGVKFSMLFPNDK